MIQTAIQLTARDHGRRMTLTEFEHAAVSEGNYFELSRGEIVVTEVPGRRHLAQVVAIQRQLYAHDAARIGQIHTLATGSDCKILISGLESERHPDIAVYLSGPPEVKDFWATWIPDLVVEIVSSGSEHRDYVEKREEYLQFGVREYWIVDAAKQQLLALRRSRGQWEEQIVKSPEIYSTPLLPGLAFNIETVLKAVEAR